MYYFTHFCGYANVFMRDDLYNHTYSFAPECPTSMVVRVLSVFLPACIALFSLMTFKTEGDVLAEPTSPSEVSLEVSKAPAFPRLCTRPPSSAISATLPLPPFQSPISTSPLELPNDGFAPLSSAPARAMSVPPALQAAPKDYTTNKPPLSAPATDALTSWAQSQWIAFNDTSVPCRGPSHQAARPRSVPLSQQPKLFSRGPAIDCFASTEREESAPNLRETAVKGVQDGKFCGMRSMFKYINDMLLLTCLLFYYVNTIFILFYFINFNSLVDNIFVFCLFKSLNSSIYLFFFNDIYFITFI